VHVATARRAGATCFATNDLRVRGRAGVEIIRLSEITFGAGEAETWRKARTEALTALLHVASVRGQMTQYWYFS
jgi:hypothetical protein